MTDCKEPPETQPLQASRGFLLVGLGVREAVGPGALPPLPRIADRLADRLDLILLELELPGDSTPDVGLTALQEVVASQRSGGWMAPLGVDPGLTLAEGGCWAQALGAWRQPVVLVIPAGQLDSGLAAAGTALLHQWRVPLLGLLQWEGDWDGAARRADGLPWLGRLAGDAASAPASGASLSEREEEASLATALALRWRQLDLA